MAEDLDPTCVESEQAADEPNDGGLATPVRPEQAVVLAPLDADRDVVHGCDRRLAPIDLEPLGGVLDQQGGRTGRNRAGEGPARGRRLSRFLNRDAHWLPLGWSSRSWMTAGGDWSGNGLAARPEAFAPARGHEKSRGPDLAHGSGVGPGGDAAWV